MIEPDGSLRPHWRLFVSMLDDLGREEVLPRWDQARRLIRENGITHNVYGDPDGPGPPLEPGPAAAAAPGRRVAGGRARRWSSGPGCSTRCWPTCTARRRASPAGCCRRNCVYANPGFLRPCHGIEPAARAAGCTCTPPTWSAAPTGSSGSWPTAPRRPSARGTALENRIVLTRVLPTVFRQCNVQRLAPFFIALRQTLASLAPANRENPRVVLLTPGPYNETYFEHAYLARYLGYTLVQGNDLTVRDCRVYLKTLSGLQRVDVILRRVDDDFCDPLELYPHSFLGVPGLLQAVREGNVAVANALGSGVVQAPAFSRSCPRLCRQLLGEELKLPSVQTWWCGDADVAAATSWRTCRELVIKPAFPTARVRPGVRRRAVRGRAGRAGRADPRPARRTSSPRSSVVSYIAPVLLERRRRSRGGSSSAPTWPPRGRLATR